MAGYRFVEYMCSHCGAKHTIGKNLGKPNPGVCLRRGTRKNGVPYPHVWTINRKLP